MHKRPHISSLLLHIELQLLTSALQVTCSLRMALSEASKASIEPYALGRLPPPAERIDLQSSTQTRQMLEACNEQGENVALGDKEEGAGGRRENDRPV